MTAAAEPQYFDLSTFDTFALHDVTGAELVRLSPTLGIQGSTGETDPYDWTHSPGSLNWFPLGDGIQRERPRLTLAGEMVYQSPDEALIAIAQVRAALVDARELWWRDVKLDDLNQFWPGSYLPEFVGGIVNHVRHVLVLNTGRTITASDLVSGGQGIVPLSRQLPYVSADTTSAVPVTFDFMALLGRLAKSGSVNNLGDTELTVVLHDGANSTAPLTVQVRTSFDLTMPVTGLTIAPVAGDIRFQVVVQ